MTLIHECFNQDTCFAAYNNEPESFVYIFSAMNLTPIDSWKGHDGQGISRPN